MKPAGIRLQLSLALMALVVLAFVPLFFAVASLTRTTMRAERDGYARALGRVVAARVVEAQANRGPGALVELMDAQIGGSSGLVALGVYDQEGAMVSRAGAPLVVDSLPNKVTPGSESIRLIQIDPGRAVEVTMPGKIGSVVTIVRTDDDATRMVALVKLVGLYTAAVAFTLLVFAYISLGRLVVRPIDKIRNAAVRVTEGARALEVPHEGAREFVELGHCVSDMTQRLRAEEKALRDKVTELERTTVELRQAQNDLMSAQQGLVRSERLASVGRLAAGLAHEVGNPLAAIASLSELLADDLPADERQDFARRVHSEAERIQKIIRDLLDFARPVSQKSESQPFVAGDVANALTHVESLLKPQKSFRDMKIEIVCENRFPKVALSEEHLVQILLNLLLNAADATENHGHVLIVARGSEQGVQLEIEDNGPGIDPSIGSTLFEPFVTTKEVGKGTGLGLAVCRGLIEECGGTISVESKKEGTGARFVLNIPTAQHGGPAPSSRAKMRVV